MKLLIGQRLRLESDEMFARIISGKVEAYAVTRDAASFRQIFLRDVQAGAAAFPSLDDFEMIDIILYCTDDAELELIPFDQCKPDELKALMKDWFGGLIELPWVKFLADSGDDMLIQWRDGSLFSQSDTLDELRAEFAEHEQLFSMMLGVRFQSEDKRLSQRLKVRARNKRKLIDNSVGNLLGEDDLLYEESTSYDQRLEQSTFIVRCVARALKMPGDNISIAPELTDKLDQIGLLRRLMQKGNMQMRFITLENGWHKKDSGVMIGYYGADKELAALIPDAPDRYRVVTKNFPDGRRVDDAVAADISTDAFACYAGLPNRPLKLLDLLKFTVKQCWTLDYSTVIGVSLIAGLLPLITPIITETIFADIVPILDRRGLATVTQVILVSSFSLAILHMIRAIAVVRITSRIGMSVEAALWSRLPSLPTAFFRRFTVGDLTNRMIGLDRIKQILSVAYVGVLCNLIFSFWSILLMGSYSLQLTAVAVGLWLIWSLVMIIIYRQMIGTQRELIALANSVSGIVQQIFAGLAKFRIQGAEEQAYHLWAKPFGAQSLQRLKFRRQNNLVTVITAVQPLFLSMVLYFITIGMLEKDASIITPPQFMAFQAAYTAFNATLGAVFPIIGQLFALQPYIENLRPILSETPEIMSDKADAGKLSGALSIDHLTFAYESGDDVLHDVTFKIAAGEHVAIVGKSGCGKSTLVRLILGFETPKHGAVYFDDQDLSELNLPSVRSQMGVVLQNGQLMTGDIFNNIIGTGALTQDDAWAAAEAAGIADDIAQMPMGMQTVISEGSSNISGGQRQRILIARALVNKPAILIFDEATSALDNRSQAIVTESIDRLNVTRIVIAHRLSTIRNADRIIVMDRGRVVEHGTFDELLSLGGIFTALVKRQEV